MDVRAVQENARINDTFRLTRHAGERMGTRGFSLDTVRAVLDLGRITQIRGATIYAVGRKEIARHSADGKDLTRLDGVQVVCSDDGAVMTVYRNRDLRGLRPGRRSRRSRWNRRSSTIQG